MAGEYRSYNRQVAAQRALQSPTAREVLNATSRPAGQAYPRVVHAAPSPRGSAPMQAYAGPAPSGQCGPCAQPNPWARQVDYSQWSRHKPMNYGLGMASMPVVYDAQGNAYPCPDNFPPIGPPGRDSGVFNPGVPIASTPEMGAVPGFFDQILSFPAQTIDTTTQIFGPINISIPQAILGRIIGKQPRQFYAAISIVGELPLNMTEQTLINLIALRVGFSFKQSDRIVTDVRLEALRLQSGFDRRGISFLMFLLESDLGQTNFEITTDVALPAPPTTSYNVGVELIIQYG